MCHNIFAYDIEWYQGDGEMSIVEELYSGMIKEVEQLYPHSAEYKRAERSADQAPDCNCGRSSKGAKKRFGR